MFLCALVRPQYYKEGKVVLDLNVKIWTFVGSAEAKISSQNRSAEMLEMKPFVVSRYAYGTFMVSKEFPHIHSVWPAKLEGTTKLQQNNT